MLEKLLSLPVEQKIGQLFFIGIPGPELDQHTQGLLDYVSPGGICLFARNIREAEQTRRLNDELAKYFDIPPFLSLDQEGGLVDRLRRILTPMPAANRIRTKDQAARLGDIIAESIRLLGFNMDFAPVVDVIDDERQKFSNGLQSRGFGRGKDDVIEMADAFARSLKNGGCLLSLKHFPGLGASEVDSHEELAGVNLIIDELEANDLAPYRELIQAGLADSIMVAHACFPKIDLQEAGQDGKLLPSSLSYNFITKLLRNKMGYDGMVLTDDLEMGAIIKNYGIGDACTMAIGAGVDMLSICADAGRIKQGFDAVMSAYQSGEITETRIDESLKRIYALKERLSSPISFDIERLGRLSNEIEELNLQLNS